MLGESFLLEQERVVLGHGARGAGEVYCVSRRLPNRVQVVLVADQWLVEDLVFLHELVLILSVVNH